MATTTATTQTRPYRSADRDAGANPLAAPLGVLGLLACPVLLPAWAVWAAALLAWTLLVRLVPALHRAPLYATPLAALALFGWLWRAGHADPFGGWLTQQGVDALASTKDGYLAAQHDAWAALWDASQTAAAGGELWVGQSRALLTTLPALWPAYTQAVGGISVVMGLGAALLCAFAGALRPSPSSPSESARSSSPASRTSPRLPAAPHTPYGGGGRAERRRDGEMARRQGWA